MDKIERIQIYLQKYLSTRIQDYKTFIFTTSNNRREGIYNLKRGNILMDFLLNIDEYLDRYIYTSNLIPEAHVSPEKFIEWLFWFKKELEEIQKDIDASRKTEKTSYTLNEIQSIQSELLDMTKYAIYLYDDEQNFIPLLALRDYLKRNDLENFFKVIQGVLASISYAISRQKEGYFHSHIHLVLKLLGIQIVSEAQTSDGRIDAIINMPERLYIFEFKSDSETEAFKQIENMEYATPFILENKEIILVGVSFSTKKKNIIKFIQQKYDYKGLLSKE